MNLILSIDESIAEPVRQAALAMGMSLEQAVQGYIEQLADNLQLAADLQHFQQSALHSPGRLAGWAFDRESANTRE